MAWEAAIDAADAEKCVHASFVGTVLRALVCLCVNHTHDVHTYTHHTLCMSACWYVCASITHITHITHT